MRRLYILFALSFFMSFAAYAEEPALQTAAKQAYVIDFDTGAVLYEKDADARMPTASMSKVMTMYLVFDALKAGRLKLEDELLVSQRAWETQGSKMWVPINEKVKVEDLIRGVIIQSGNDATIVLAEALAGSEDAFALAMTKRAKEIGMENSNFKNASGWPDPEHYSTPHDLAIMAQRLIKDFPEYYPYYSEKEFTYHDIKQGNRNPLLYRNIGVDGVKTGHTEEAGYGLIASAMQDGRRIVAVLSGMKDQQERADESARIVQWALGSFTNISLFKTPKEIERIPVVFGEGESVGVAVAEPLMVTVPKMDRESATVEISYQSPLIAPVKEGQNVGKATVKIPGVKDIVVPLVTVGAVEEAGLFGKIMQKAKMMLGGKA
ncbi:MAG: D-alanyl-D-alanine carboxypeptidase [Alphaproteobacteria bacterium]|nr:D-alanyl-D-alanine carboxypeptidase [Alphaproteobacteria bacterium]MBP7757689.1 D-alanyl-D-alanine carboxypeptidase [Alphaproteobacteria bacterium]MBP7761111.1 D-alanyl-D-alanine carboxypeptidase [Alphaproteobacteria bacterium]MBP7904721.1 D-alanyl-D-alanine carboxypeptidase [Alphaproteobacteria bacterium]